MGKEKDSIIYNELKLDHSRIHNIHKVHVTIAVICFFIEVISGKAEFSFQLLISAIYLFFLAQLSFKTLKSISYSFWTFSILLAFYFLIGLLKAAFIYDSSQLFLLYLLSIALIFGEFYLFSSPIFYPRIAWWEYDFRYRFDLPITFFHEDKSYTGRLMDLRRKAGCIVLFEEFYPGDLFHIKSPTIGGEIELQGEIISKKEYLVGRGYCYGVKFILNSKNELLNFENFCEYWKISTKARIKSKFTQKNHDKD